MAKKFNNPTTTDYCQFYRIPKILFTPRFSALCIEAKLLYGLMLDRADLSVRNGWLDDRSRIYIYYSVEDICAVIGCARKKALKLLGELDKAGLTERKVRGQGKATLIFIKNVDWEASQKTQNGTSECVQTTLQEVPFEDFKESQTDTLNHTNQNQTDFSQTHSIPSPTPSVPEEKKRGEAMQEIELDFCRDEVRDALDCDRLFQDNPADTELVDEMVELVTETLCSKRKKIRVMGEAVPAEVVRSRLRKLTGEHIQFALDSLKENTTKIRNIRQYLLTVLFNAPVTISSYYSAKVNYDLHRAGWAAWEVNRGPGKTHKAEGRILC